jgi:hypothetical protein
VYFISGFLGYVLAYAWGPLRLRRAYVFAHELTHALAAWAQGAKVFRFVVRKESGHVDLSHSNAFIALAPYWIPTYTLLLVGIYRLILWFGPRPYAYEVFLFLMGSSLAFHLLHTAESLWSEKQSDLNHVGLAFSLTLVAFLNGILLLVALKCLFPKLVSLQESLHWIAAFTLASWSFVARYSYRGMTVLWQTLPF